MTRSRSGLLVAVLASIVVLGVTEIVGASVAPFDGPSAARSELVGDPDVPGPLEVEVPDAIEVEVPGGIGVEVEVEVEAATLEGAEVITNSEASGGEAVRFTGPGDVVVIDFEVPEAGSYQISGLVLVSAGDFSNDSVRVAIDGDAGDVWHFDQTRTATDPTFVTDDVSAVGTGSRLDPEFDPRTFVLSAGSHRLELSYREPLAVIDKLTIVQTSSTPEPPEPPSDGDQTERDRYWADQGYELFWVGTPSESDVGTSVESFFREKWAGDYPLRGYKEDRTAGTVSIAAAPDGSPSLKGVINQGENDLILHVYGNQFGPQGPEKTLVASMEWFNPCEGGQKGNGRNGTYIGFGHVWGSADGVNSVPGGGSSAAEAWSYRLALTTSNYFAGYAYTPDRSGSSGKSIFTKKQPVCGRWQTLETEITQNDIGSRNGSIRIFVDGELAAEERNTQTRLLPTVRPKGHGVLIKHNAGAPNQETYYLRNWKLYVK